MMTASRESLAKVQADLVHALVTAGPTPVGFDEARLRATARSLLTKRRQALLRVWPALPKLLGERFVEQFEQYARTRPLPSCGSPLGDGRAFLQWLESQSRSSDALRLEAMQFDLRFVSSRHGLHRRHGFALTTAKLPEARTWRIAFRLPWLGEHFWNLPLRS
jgi:hypothetical protein